MVWFLHDLGRLKCERLAIEQLQKHADWLHGVTWGLHEDQLFVDADVEAHGVVYPLRMQYPSTFPASPPCVRPRGEFALSRLSSHQYASGELCLEWGADTWVSEITGAHVLESAQRLFELENPAGGDQRIEIVAPSRHHLTAGQELRFNICRLVTTSNLRGALPRLKLGEIAESDALTLPWQAESWTIFIQSIRFEEGEWRDLSIPSRLEHHASTQPALVCRVETQINMSPKSLDNLIDTFDAYPAVQERLRSKSHRYLVTIDPHDNICALYIPKPEGHFLSIKSVASDTFSAALRSPSLLASVKRVGIVGLGSAGGKVAVSLARYGVQRFVLVDDDVVLPENIIRNELDWRSVGEHKVDALADRMRLVSSDIAIQVHRVRLAGQESNTTTATALEALAECDLVIDATADPAVFNVLSMIVTTNARALIWLEVYTGGIGGLVARSRHGKDPSPQHMRRTFNAFTSSRDEDRPIAVAPYAGIDPANALMIAGDADVAIIADYAVNMAIDFLHETEPAAFPYSMYLIGLRRGWIFEAPFHTIPIDVGTAPPSEDPNEALSAEEFGQELKFVGGLIDAVKNGSVSAG